MSAAVEHRYFPTLSKMGVLRQSRSRVIVSTAALYEVLGNKAYQKCLPHFVYIGNASGPLAEPLEQFLGKDGDGRIPIHRT